MTLENFVLLYLRLLLYCILYMISTTIVLKFTRINNFLIYISVKDHGGVFFIQRLLVQRHVFDIS